MSDTALNKLSFATWKIQANAGLPRRAALAATGAACF
jgi:hypothetical protein